MQACRVGERGRRKFRSIRVRREILRSELLSFFRCLSPSLSLSLAASSSEGAKLQAEDVFQWRGEELKNSFVLSRVRCCWLLVA